MPRLTPFPDDDAIGNRMSATRGLPGETATGGVRSTAYQSNHLNQYTQITRPNALEVTGLTLADVPRVSVNGQPPSGRPPGNGEDGGFALWLDNLATGSDNDGIGNWPTVTVTVAKPGAGANGTDLHYVKQGRSYVRPSEAPVHDADGNLTQDAAFTYTWDAENRLIAAEMRATGVPLAMPLLRVECDYDAQGRRIAKRVRQKATPAGSSTRASAWTLVSTTQFWYDGWNLVAEVAVNPLSTSLLRTYAWGLDLSGTAQGAGGVGGLLGIEDALGHLYAVCTDANGNVMGLIESRQGQLVARYDYDPFGNLVTNWQAPGQSAAVCPFRFSTKYLDEGTGLLYYGFRYYSPELGRWFSKDLIEEEGGINLYGMAGNDCLNHVDILGNQMSDNLLGVDKKDKACTFIVVVGHSSFSIPAVANDFVNLLRGQSEWEKGTSFLWYLGCHHTHNLYTDGNSRWPGEDISDPGEFLGTGSSTQSTEGPDHKTIYHWKWPHSASNGGLNPDPNADHNNDDPNDQSKRTYHQMNEALGYAEYVRQAWFKVTYTASRVLDKSNGLGSNKFLTCCPEIRVRFISSEGTTIHGNTLSNAANTNLVRKASPNWSPINLSATFNYQHAQPKSAVKMYPSGGTTVIFKQK